MVSLLTLAFTGQAPNSGHGIGRCLCLPPDDYISTTFESLLECDVIGAGLTETSAAVALPRVSLSSVLPFLYPLSSQPLRVCALACPFVRDVFSVKSFFVILVEPYLSISFSHSLYLFGLA